MSKHGYIVFAAVVLSIFSPASISKAQQKTRKTVPVAASPRATTAPRPIPEGMPLESQQALVKQYCSGCHNEKLKSGGMTLTALDLAHAEKTPELAEKVIRKLRVGLMPPVGSPRPDAETLKL